MKNVKSIAAAFCLTTAALGGAASAQTAPQTKSGAIDSRAIQPAANTCRTYQEVYGRDCTAQQLAGLIQIYSDTLAQAPAATDAEKRARVQTLLTSIAGVLNVPVAELVNPPVTPEALERRLNNKVRDEVNTVCDGYAEQSQKTCTAAQRDQIGAIIKDEMKRPNPTTQQELQQRTLDLVNNIRKVFGLPALKLDSDQPSTSTPSMNRRYTA